jgi:polysaccharide biosynthesis protein PslG
MNYFKPTLMLLGALMIIFTSAVGSLFIVSKIVPRERVADTVSALAVDPSLRASIESGVQFHCIWSSYTDEDREAVLDKIVDANIDRVRIDMAWDGLEESKGQPNKWYVGQADKCVNMAKKRGLEVLITMHMTPDWANGDKGTAAPPSDVKDFGDFMTWSADHFKGRVSAYEIWNEPDPDQKFFTGTTAEYVAMLKAGYTGVKESDVDAKVVLGAPSTNDDAWIKEIYELGAKDYFDIMATHPYQAVADAPPEYPDDGNKWWLSHFPTVLEVMKEYDDEDKEVWFTEFGYSTHSNSPDVKNHQRGVSEAEQAAYLVRAFEYVQQKYPTVTAMYIYGERDRVDADTHLNGYGILKSDLEPKRSYFALKRYFQEPSE